MTDIELNEAVARKLGWVTDDDFRFDPYLGKDLKPRSRKLGWIKDPDGVPAFFTAPPDYCHSIEAAWEVVEWIKKESEKSFRVNFKIKFWGIGYLAEVFGEESEADTAPMAIVLSFLKLMEDKHG